MPLQQVIARIEGGLGNQLFQYAAARSLADRLGCDLALDLRGLAENGDRPYQLDVYKTRCAVADSALLESLPPWRSSRSGRIKSRMSHLVPGLYNYPVFWPRDFSFDPRFERIQQPVYLVGYWQSEKYFAWNRSRLLQDMHLVLGAQLSQDWMSKIQSTNSVSMHIRRGDYVSNPAAAQFHGLCDMSYYQQAVAALKLRCPELEVFVFSDEPQWAKDHLVLGVPTHIVDAHTAEQGHLDMALMRQCHHHIIANSSFSWWGAWLCTHPGQQVIAPRQWFADRGVNTRDVVPEHWTLM